MTRPQILGAGLGLTLAAAPMPALVNGLVEAHEARMEIASARARADEDTARVLGSSPVNVIPVRLDPRELSAHNCSGSFVNGNLYSSRHCFYAENGKGELLPLTFDVIASDGTVLSTVQSSDFAVDGSDFSVLRKADATVCERAPIKGEAAWTVHWVGMEDRPRPSEFVVGEPSKDLGLPRLLAMQNVRAGTDVYKGSSGAGVFATSDGCLLGVISARYPMLPGGIELGETTSYFTAAK